MAASPSPLVGYNTNVRHKGKLYHIQTEDSGVKRPHVITQLFADGGRILASEKTSYEEHLQIDNLAVRRSDSKTVGRFRHMRPQLAAAHRDFHRQFADGAADEQAGSHGRGAQTDTEVGDHHDAEMHRVHAQRLGHRQEDRREDQHRRGHVHEGAHRQEDDVDQEYDQNFNIVFSGKKRQDTHEGKQCRYTDD